MVVLIFLNRYYGCNLLSRLELQDIDDGRTSCRSPGLGNFIGLYPIYLTGICKEHQIMVGGCHQKFFDIIIVYRFHSFDTLTSTILTVEIINAHSFDISQFCHRYHCIGDRNQVFHGNVIFIKSNRSSSFISIFIRNRHDFLANHTKQFLFISKNRFQLCNQIHQLIVFRFQLTAFQTGQRTQTHIYDCLCLCL